MGGSRAVNPPAFLQRWTLSNTYNSLKSEILLNIKENTYIATVSVAHGSLLAKFLSEVNIAQN
jgi:hypothetical protein